MKEQDSARIAAAIDYLREAMQVAGMSGEFGLTLRPRDETILKTAPMPRCTFKAEQFEETNYADGRPPKPARIQIVFNGVPVGIYSAATD